MDYNKRNDCNKINSMSCMRIYHVPGPQGPTGPTGSVESNPYNLYVQSTAAPNGDGSQARPFQTIDEALAVAEPNGIINIFQGMYSITQQISLNIPGLTIKGRADH